MHTAGWKCVCALGVLLWASAASGQVRTIYVGAGGNLQRALDEAAPGDTLLLAEGAEFVGNFVLPLKSGEAPITLQTSAPESLLPGSGERIRPSHAPLLARLRSPNSMSVLRTAAGTQNWRLRYLEFAGNQNGYGDILQIGDGSRSQDTLAKVPRNILLDHVYIHGDPSVGQKRCVALNAAHVTIIDSHIAECKGVGLDTQAIGGWNGPGPYVIENNYLEGAGENVLFGGADPAIPNLVADGIVFRRNYLSRPMSWRDPIISTPTGLTGTTEAGGLPAGDYGYRVVARGPVGMGTTGRSTASAQVLVTVADGGAVRLRWTPVAGATEYRVYGRTPGGQNMYWRVTTAEFVDSGAAGVAESVPTSRGTVWTVKNVFELKNARNVLVEDNIFENHWREAQPGYAIVFTPRNSGGSCTWCVVERVRFQYNLVRNVAAGINLLGYDTPSTPSLQANTIEIVQNLFAGVTTTLGGNGWFLQVGDEPRDLVIENNTIDSNGGSVMYTYGGTSTSPRIVYGLRMSANAARHGNYGFSGAHFSYGNGVLAGYYPDAIFTGNYLAGGSASRYPAGTLVSGAFNDQFVDVASGDFTLRSGSVLRGAAPGGGDIGVDYPALAERLRGVQAGLPATSAASLPPSADFTTACTFLDCTFSDASTPGSAPVTAWAWALSDGTTASDATFRHTFGRAGVFTVALTVADAQGRTATVSREVTVEAPNAPPVAHFTVSCADLTCTFTCGSTDADGTIASRVWRFADGTSGTGRVFSRTYAAPGHDSVTLEVRDDRGDGALETKAVAIVGLVHVGNLDGAVTLSERRPAGSWSATVRVTVHGANERLIPNALVEVAWSGAVARTDTCETDANGVCTLDSGRLNSKRDSVTLTVTGVSAPSSVYDGTNHDNDGSSSGTTITMFRP